MKIRYRDKEWELEGERTVREAIEAVGLTPERVIAVRDGKVLSQDTLLEEGEEIKLLAVITGG